MFCKKVCAASYLQNNENDKKLKAKWIVSLSPLKKTQYICLNSFLSKLPSLLQGLTLQGRLSNVVLSLLIMPAPKLGFY